MSEKKRFLDLSGLTYYNSLILAKIDAKQDKLWEKGSGDHSIQQIGSAVASGQYAYAEGNSEAVGNRAHAEGQSTKAIGAGSHSEGVHSKSIGGKSHAEGNRTTASGSTSHAEGWTTQALGDYSHAEGYNTTASGDSSHAEGDSTTASSDFSHAEGDNTTASGDSSHAEGDSTTASGNFSHAEGYITKSIGNFSHAEGFNTQAIGSQSHSEGSNTVASGVASHAEGYYTQTFNDGEHAEGSYNVSVSGGTNNLETMLRDGTTDSFDKSTLSSIGNGGYYQYDEENDDYSIVNHNAFEVKFNGDIYVQEGSATINIDNSSVIYPSMIKLQDRLKDIDSKASTATTLNGYGITDAYTKTQTDSAIGNKVAKAGDTMTGILNVPQVNSGNDTAKRILATGTNTDSFFQTRKMRGEGIASNYNHAVDWGYAGHNQVDLYEYGAKWVFHKHTNAQTIASGDTIVATIAETGITASRFAVKADSATNADKVNNHTVNKDVPADAVFTDTTYDSITTSEIDQITDE